MTAKDEIKNLLKQLKPEELEEIGAEVTGILDVQINFPTFFKECVEQRFFDGFVSLVVAKSILLKQDITARIRVDGGSMSRFPKDILYEYRHNILSYEVENVRKDNHKKHNPDWAAPRDSGKSRKRARKSRIEVSATSSCVLPQAWIEMAV